MLREGWYLMSTAELERELDRWRGGAADPSTAIPLSVAEALAYRNAGNVPDVDGRCLRLVLILRDESDLRHLQQKRERYEPDFHEAPSWKREGSKPVNVVPLRETQLTPTDAGPWWEQPDVGQLEEEWQASGAVGDLVVPGRYRSFVFKTVLSLRAAGRAVTPESVADSIERWLGPEDAGRIRTALLEVNRQS